MNVLYVLQVTHFAILLYLYTTPSPRALYDDAESEVSEERGVVTKKKQT